MFVNVIILFFLILLIFDIIFLIMLEFMYEYNLIKIYEEYYDMMSLFMLFDF